MSKEFEIIKNDVAKFRQETVIQHQKAWVVSEKAAEEEKVRKQVVIDRDKLLLEESGVINLFKEIIENGLVSSGSRKVSTSVPVYREKLFGKKIIDHYDEKITYERRPARIEASKNEYSGCGDHSCFVYVSLIFDEYDTGTNSEYEAVHYHHSEITIGVVDNNLSLKVVNKNSTYSHFTEYTYIPIREGELLTTIANGIKNPPIKD